MDVSTGEILLQQRNDIYTAVRADIYAGQVSGE